MYGGLDRASLEDRLYLGKIQINLEFPSLIRTFELRSKVLSLGNSQINLEFPSLIRTFAGGCPAKTDIEDEKGKEQRAAPVIYT